MIPQPTNEGGSEAEARFERAFKRFMSLRAMANPDPMRDVATAMWKEQDFYWSKRCEAMEKALDDIARIDYTRAATNLGCFHAVQIAREALDALKEGGKE